MILLKQRTSTKMMFFLSNYKKIGQGEKNMDKLIIEALNKNSEIKQLKKRTRNFTWNESWKTEKTSWWSYTKTYKLFKSM